MNMSPFIWRPIMWHDDYNLDPFGLDPPDDDDRERDMPRELGKELTAREVADRLQEIMARMVRRKAHAPGGDAA